MPTYNLFFVDSEIGGDGLDLPADVVGPVTLVPCPVIGRNDDAASGPFGEFLHKLILATRELVPDEPIVLELWLKGRDGGWAHRTLPLESGKQVQEAVSGRQLT